MDQLEQVRQLAGLQGEVDGVDGLAPEGGVHHDGRERGADGIAGDAVDLGGGVDMVDAVGLDEGAGGDLAGAGLFAGSGGGEGEGAAGAHAEHAGDDAGVAHADADDVGVVVHAFEEADEGDVVDQGLGGGDDFDEVGGEALNAGVDAVQITGGGEVVIADDQGDAGVAQLLQFALLRASADSSSRSTRWKPVSAALERISTSAATEPGNFPPLGAPAGGDGSGGGVIGEELFQLGQGRQRLVEVIQAELEEWRLLDDGRGLLDHLGGAWSRRWPRRPW